MFFLGGEWSSHTSGGSCFPRKPLKVGFGNPRLLGIIGTNFEFLVASMNGLKR